MHDGTERTAEFGLLEIEGFYHGKWWKDFQPWRLALAEMIGADIVYELGRAPLSCAEVPAGQDLPANIQVLSARSISGAPAMEVTSAMRSGQWSALPEEPLLVVLLLTMPGMSWPARHAAAIARRLSELTELIHQIDDGTRTVWRFSGVHDAAIGFFERQAAEGHDVACNGHYLDRINDFDLQSIGALQP